ncbi:MAG: succinylglutamate desuccinylase/aspartoacylase family protein, partial [Pseudomonadota bacterium]
DLNRCFPGSSKGSAASRLAHRFCEQILQQVDVAIDLHTAAVHRTNLAQIRVTAGDERARALADAFAAPVIVASEVREGSLRADARLVKPHQSSSMKRERRCALTSRASAPVFAA